MLNMMRLAKWVSKEARVRAPSPDIFGGRQQDTSPHPAANSELSKAKLGADRLRPDAPPQNRIGDPSPPKTGPPTSTLPPRLPNPAGQRNQPPNPDADRYRPRPMPRPIRGPVRTGPRPAPGGGPRIPEQQRL